MQEPFELTNRRHWQQPRYSSNNNDISDTNYHHSRHRPKHQHHPHLSHRLAFAANRNDKRAEEIFRPIGQTDYPTSGANPDDGDEFNTLSAHVKSSSIRHKAESLPVRDQHPTHRSTRTKIKYHKPDQIVHVDESDVTNEINPPLVEHFPMGHNSNEVDEIIRPTMKRSARVDTDHYKQNDENNDIDASSHLIKASNPIKRTMSSDRLTILAEPNESYESPPITRHNDDSYVSGSQMDPMMTSNEINPHRETILPTNHLQIHSGASAEQSVSTHSSGTPAEGPQTPEFSSPTPMGYDFAHSNEAPNNFISPQLVGHSQTQSDFNSAYLFSSLMLVLISAYIGYLILRCLTSKNRRKSSSKHDWWQPTVNLLTPSKGRKLGHQFRIGKRTLARASDGLNSPPIEMSQHGLAAATSRDGQHDNNNCQDTNIIDCHEHKLSGSKTDGDLDSIEVIQTGLDQPMNPSYPHDDESPVSKTSKVAANIKKHLARNSLVVAASSGGLCCGGSAGHGRSSKVIKLAPDAPVGGKFIDDEARELRKQRHLGTSIRRSTRNFGCQIKCLLGDWFEDVKQATLDGRWPDKDCHRSRHDRRIGKTDIVVIVTHHQEASKGDNPDELPKSANDSADNDSVALEADGSSSCSSSAIAADQSSSSSNNFHSVDVRESEASKSFDKQHDCPESFAATGARNDHLNETLTTNSTNGEILVGSAMGLVQQQLSHAPDVDGQTELGIPVGADEASLHQAMYEDSNSPMSALFSPSPGEQHSDCNNAHPHHLASMISSCRICTTTSCNPSTTGNSFVADRSHQSVCQQNHGRPSHFEDAVDANTGLPSEARLASTCRPCCSASPSSMVANSVEAEGTGPRGQIAATYDLFQQDQDHVQHQQHQMSPNGKSRSTAGHPFVGTHRVDRQGSVRVAKRQHHYENYYDDEQEEAYRQLTATIGIQFGLNLNGDHLHHNHHHGLISSAAVTEALERPGCKCCSDAAGLAIRSGPASTTVGPDYTCECPAGGQVSTSLAQTEPALVASLCPDAECSVCRQTSSLPESRQYTQPTTSILVQQPSTATPPPLQITGRHQHSQCNEQHHSVDSARWADSAADQRLPNTGRPGAQLAPSVESSSGAASDQEQPASANNSTSVTTSNLTDASADHLDGSLESASMMMMLMMQQQQPKRRSVEPSEMMNLEANERNGQDLGAAVRAYASASPLLSTSPNFGQRLNQLKQQHQQATPARFVTNEFGQPTHGGSSPRRRFSNRTLGSSYRVRDHTGSDEQNRSICSMSNDYSNSGSPHTRQAQSPGGPRRRRMSFGGDYRNSNNKGAAFRRLSTSSANAHSCNPGQLRLSPAGDQSISRQLTSLGLSGAACQPGVATANSNNSNTHQLRHRASVAAEGSAAWWPSMVATSAHRQQQQPQLPFGRPRIGSGPAQQLMDYHNQQHYHQQRQLGAQQQYYQHHYDNHDQMQQRRPSECSLPSEHHADNLQCCATYGGGSSSAGSSSGIGFSGSQCTNTPTASSFPYASFGLVGQAGNLGPDTGINLQEPGLLTCLDGGRPYSSDAPPNQQQMARPMQVDFQGDPTNESKHQIQMLANNTNMYPTSMCQSSIVQLQLQQHHHHQRHDHLGAHQTGLHQLPASSCCSSRKFSLPVQLESRQIGPNGAQDMQQCKQRQMSVWSGQPTSGSPRPQCKRAALLFEENLERVDSGCSLQQTPTKHCSAALDEQQEGFFGQVTGRGQACSQAAGYIAGGQPVPSDFAPPGDSFRWWPSGDPLTGGQVGSRASRASGGGREFSRRSSQTITRQSSFWLDDNGSTNTNTVADSAVVSLNGSLACASGRQSLCDEAGSQLGPELAVDGELGSLEAELATQGQQCSAAPAEPSLDDRTTAGWPPDQMASSVPTSGSSQFGQQTSGQLQGPRSACDWPVGTRPPLGDNCPPSPSSSSAASVSSPRDKTRPGGCPFRAMAAAAAAGRPVGRSRLSSSSTTSSTGSSPSPDFGARPPSQRILALGSKSKQSSSITKRRLFGRLRVTRTGGASSSHPNNNHHGHQYGPASARLARSNGPSDATSSMVAAPSSSGLPEGSSLDDNNRQYETNPNENGQRQDGGGASVVMQQQPCDADECHSNSVSVDAAGSPEESNFFADSPSSAATKQSSPAARPIVDLNSSASLERQCRDLWKLRATLHGDSCVANDDWSNYHQRLNRRYDSGYKSIENQFSSSIEGGNTTAASMAENEPTADRLNTPTPTQCQTTNMQQEQQQQQVLDAVYPRPPSGCSGFVQPPRSSEELESSIEDPTQHPTKQVLNLLDDSPRFSDLNLAAGETGENNHLTAGSRVEFIDSDPRDCHSRSSKSSNEAAES